LELTVSIGVSVGVDGFCIQGDSLLHVLCKMGQVDAAAAVIRKGADVNILDKVIP
jgi:hypothetical protein